MPCHRLTDFLVKHSLSMTGYPEIPFLGKIVEDDVKGSGRRKLNANKQGIKNLGTANVRIPYNACKNKMIALIPQDKAGMKSWLSYL